MSKEPPGLLTSSLKMDMMHFKDETLRDMRQMHSKLDTKYTKVEETLNENLSKFDLKINSFFFKDLIEAEEQGVLNHKGKGSNNNEEEDEGNDEEIKNINNNQYKYKYN